MNMQKQTVQRACTKRLADVTGRKELHFVRMIAAQTITKLNITYLSALSAAL